MLNQPLPEDPPDFPRLLKELMGLPVVLDDALYARARTEQGVTFEDVHDAYDWAAEAFRPSTGQWPDCGHQTRCAACPDYGFIVSTKGDIALQTIDHRTGRPYPPESSRRRQEARRFAGEHDRAQTWLRVTYEWQWDDDDF